MSAGRPAASARDRTTIPSPPNHCIQARVNRKASDRLCGSGTRLKPVVVTPETASNQASTAGRPAAVRG